LLSKRLRVQGSGFRVQGSGFKPQPLNRKEAALDLVAIAIRAGVVGGRDLSNEIALALEAAHFI
jgi:hypothetical protein